MFPASDTSKSCNWHSNIGNWNYSGLGRVGSARSNSDYKAISASQQSWSLGLAELGKMLVKKTVGQKKNSKEFLVQKTFKSMKIIGQINFESKQILGPKKFCVKKFGFKNILGPKKF